MNKIVVGCTVRCVEPSDYAGIKNLTKGELYKVSSLNEPYIYLEGVEYPWFIHRFERVFEAEKFFKGDVVVCADNGWLAKAEITIGKQYVITSIAHDHAYVDNDLGTNFGYVFKRFKHLSHMETGVEPEPPACVMTQDQYAALKASLEKLQAENKTAWINRHNSNVAIYLFFEEMEKQGLLSEPKPPKPKTAKEIAKNALANNCPPSAPDSDYGKLWAGLKAIAELPE